MTSKFALVIANTEYQDASFAKLTAPGKDADEFAQVLRDTECAAFDDVQVLINEGEGRTRRSIARFFAERKRDDLLLLYFSGHGVRNEVGQLFLAANDTEKNILEASGIPADFVTQSMNNSRSQRQLLILDCCNSGAFAYGTKSAAAVGKSMGIATAFEGSGFGRVVLTATDATQYAWEGDKVIGDTQKSVFTHFLIEGLKGEADRDGDGRINVDELYDYAYEQVVRRTPKQTPGKWSYKQQGDIVLRENIKPREVKPVPLPSDLLELLSHPNSSVRKVGIQDLISLLNGKHLGLARGAQEKLREIAENDDSLVLRKIAGETLLDHGFLPEAPAPFEIQREKPKEEKKIEKPIAMPMRSSEPSKPNVEKKVASNLNLQIWGGIVGGLLVIILCIWGSASLIQNPLEPPPEQPTVVTRTFTPTATRTSKSTITHTPTPTKTSIPPTNKPSPTDTSVPLVPTLNRPSMTLVYVSAGNFTMGSDSGSRYRDEEPVHTVYLDAFWIDQTEVTNVEYALCVQDGRCSLPQNTTQYFDSNYANHPVVSVSWNDATAFCSYAGGRLPTEAEWEKAARGADGRTYPWGNDAPNNNLLNYNNAVGATTEVGGYPNGASPYGALDMAGNVWEWVADWYNETYYGSSPLSNPLGPNSGEWRVVRGGAWLDGAYSVRSAVRYALAPTVVTVSHIGFRCARSP